MTLPVLLLYLPTGQTAIGIAVLALHLWKFIRLFVYGILLDPSEVDKLPGVLANVKCVTKAGNAATVAPILEEP